MGLHPKITVVTICFNIVNEIEATLKSVTGQTYANKELIVIDGASTDGTKQIIDNFTQLLTIAISEPDNGIYDAMNKGMKLATGDYVVFINGGDSFADEHTLEKIADEIKQTSEPDFVYANSIDLHGNERLYRPARCHKYAWYGMFTSHQSMFYSLKLIRRENLSYDTSYRIAADYKFTLENLKYAKTFLKSKLYTGCFSSGGISQTNKKLGLLEANRARKESRKMGRLARSCIIFLQIIARLVATYGGWIYKKIRFANHG